jgi:hypothetical protein
VTYRIAVNATDEAIEQMVELNITWVVIHQGSNLNRALASALGLAY